MDGGTDRFGIETLAGLEGWDRGLGLNYQYAHDLAWVAGKFELSRRRETPVSFTHHREVAALPPADQDRLLDWVEVDPTNIRSRASCATKLKL
jgi:hypothetical protein